ncbi:MAG: pyruvate kinase alpha/beta domain-containing protein [Clostridia bacterium]|nr:pyruvate kinase alpha/beta domain-containing protein [Clostridia bacterium]MDD4798871.1 pyruvate kinase alpha/beta domain-containing protein [Clostridia bacterium]
MFYFDQPGPANTDKTIELVKEAAARTGVNKVIIASKDGKVAAKLIGSGLNILCVTHQYGYSSPGSAPLTEEMRQCLIDGGIKILTTTHGLAGADRAIRFKFGGVYPSEIIAETLRIFGQGVKVAIEVGAMGCDCGFAAPAEPVICLGGTAAGVDTALILTPNHIHNLFDTKIIEYICLPRQSLNELKEV